MLKRLFKFEWEALAGIIAALTALVMHFLHLAESELLLLIAVALIALLFLRDLRHEHKNEQTMAQLAETRQMVQDLHANLSPPDTLLIGPRHLRSQSEQFARNAKGEMIWFHVCLLMFKNQALFDTLLRPAVENPLITNIRFTLDHQQQDLWQNEVLPKLKACRGHEKVANPVWTQLDENISFILAETASTGQTEGLLSFWGEPFMAHNVNTDVPRYIFYVQGHSELVGRLTELERKYRLTS